MDAGKRRGHDRSAPFTTLDPAAPACAPKLPPRKGRRRQTRDWYAAWVTSPQASLLTSTDWKRLHLLADLVDAYHDPDTTLTKKIDLLAEIRINEQKLGGTAEDRQRLRWKPPSPASESGTPAAPAARARRDPRLKLVKGA